ncbi:hypothetical protein E5198_00680 [Pseudomonas sp. A-1]|uniref:hypothetical protein n=1 Tax=Pseudomonas sp. A-1 TaxID=1821274 RepID=UPI0010A5DD28|nr:hypothetical protein [Pseudomonas sp. A-1]THG87067.1 hypothetical protein E5198_00680 [Pseudomonas sp. A-1]
MAMLNEFGRSLFKPWFSVQNVLLALAGIFIISLFKLSATELASWVQAIGSITAVWGAFKVSQLQREQGEVQRRESDRKKAEAYYAVVSSAVTDATVLGAMAYSNSFNGGFKENWDEYLCKMVESSFNSLKKIPAHELGSKKLVSSYAGIVSCIAQMIGKIEAAMRDTECQEQEVANACASVVALAKLLDYNWQCYKEASSAG